MEIIIVFSRKSRNFLEDAVLSTMRYKEGEVIIPRIGERVHWEDSTIILNGTVFRIEHNHSKEPKEVWVFVNCI